MVDGSGEPVTRITLPGSPTRLGSDYRRIHRRLGRPLVHSGSEYAVQRNLVPEREEVLPHQPTRTSSHKADVAPSSTSHSRPQNKTRVRQLYSGQLPEQTGRHSVLDPVSGGSATAPVADQPRRTNFCSSQTRNPQRASRLSQSQQTGPHRVGPVSKCCSVAVQTVGRSPIGPVCVSSESQTTPVVQQERGSGGSRDEHVRPDMERLVCLRLSPNESHPSDSDQDSGGRGRGDSVGSQLAQEELVSPSPPDGHGATGDVPQEDGSALADAIRARSPVSPRPGHAAVDCLEAERSAWQRKGFSRKVIDTAMAAKRASTRRVYGGRWDAYAKWCTERELQPVQAAVEQVLEFLQSLADKSLSVNTIRGYITAISARHVKIDEDGVAKSISDLAVVQTWVKGLSMLHPAPKGRVPSWDLQVVLSALKKPPFYPLEEASLKHLTHRTAFLLALVSARRASEVHAIRHDTLQWNADGVTAFLDETFLPKVHSKWHCSQPIHIPVMREDQDPELRKLCVSSSLREYLNRVDPERVEGASQLLICYGGKQKGKPVSTQRLSNWLKLTVEECYKLSNLAVPQVKGHQVRKQSTSWADLAGVKPLDICKAATWKSDNMFARHYRLHLINDQDLDLGRRVLQLSASSSAESAVQRRLGSTAGPPADNAR